MPPISLLIKPSSGSCNLSCRYCFYADEASHRQTSNCGMMTLEVLEMIVKNAFAYSEDMIIFAFQGGEPTLRGLAFYKKFCLMKEKYNKKNIKVYCAIQTNGILIDEEWAEFFRNEDFLVGVSLDGPRSINDQYRLDADGNGSFQRILKAIRILEKYDVKFNILSVLTEQSALEIGRTYNFFISKGFMYQQYIPCLNPLNEQDTEYSLTTATYGYSLKKLFDLWFNDIERGIPVHNRYFENLVGLLAGHEPESCDMRGHCSLQYVIEADGSIYPCDFYVLDDYKIGNIKSDGLEHVVTNPVALSFLSASFHEASECKDCKWEPLCRGGCRRNRPEKLDGTLAQNRFCKAYQDFFAYAIGRLEYLASSRFAK